MSSNVIVMVFIGLAVAGGAMTWSTFTTAYSEVEKTIDTESMVTHIQEINEKQIDSIFTNSGHTSLWIENTG